MPTKEKAMKKNKERYCDMCKSSWKPEKDEPHDVLAFGWKTDKCQVINKTYDICPKCMKKLKKTFDKTAKL